ncbi:unnamed protein product [Auanema sp. JU1783]|nr:unnamed protein product [Auanema sp. JU1783]
MKTGSEAYCAKTAAYVGLLIDICYFGLLVHCQLKPAIRVRLNRGIFEQASSIVAGLVEYEVPRIQIPNSQQCFTEGCVQIHSFRMTSFRLPRSISFQPSPPNQFALRVTDFDFFVTGQLSGTIQVLLQIPVAGSVYVSGRGISVTAYLDLQKTFGDEPYLRFLSCELDHGFVDTRVENMGIFTDTVNSKYRGTMSDQSRSQLEQAICANMNRLAQQHFSTRLTRLPNQISAKELVELLITENEALTKTNSTTLLKRNRRAASDDYYDDLESSPSSSSSKRTTPTPKQISFSTQNTEEPGSFKINRSDVKNFFNVERLSHIMIDLTLLDAYSTMTEFTVGMDGAVTTTKTPGSPPFDPPFPFRLPEAEQIRQAEIVISNYTLNSLLYQAHRTNSLLFHVDSKTPGVGGTLKTTCSLDEVCISDQIEEVGQKYPDRSFELIVRTTKAPTVRIEKDNLYLELSGRCLFFLEGTRQKVGVIPFDSLARIQMQTENSLVKGQMKILRLTFENSVDFFGLTASDLDGFRATIQTALENLMNKFMMRGISLNTKSLKVPLKFSSAHMSLERDVIILQANVDLFNSLYANQG